MPRKVLRPKLRFPGPVCDGSGTIHHVMYLTERQYQNYKKRIRSAKQKLRDVIRPYYEDEKGADELVEALYYAYCAPRSTIPIKIVARKKFNFVNL